jgi:hypothetical protein
MNNRVESHSMEQTGKKRNAGQGCKKLHKIKKNELWCFGLMISARIHGRQGQPWDEEEEEPERDRATCELGEPHVEASFQRNKKVCCAHVGETRIGGDGYLVAAFFDAGRVQREQASHGNVFV